MLYCEWNQSVQRDTRITFNSFPLQLPARWGLFFWRDIPDSFVFIILHKSDRATKHMAGARQPVSRILESATAAATMITPTTPTNKNKSNHEENSGLEKGGNAQERQGYSDKPAPGPPLTLRL